VTDEDVDVLEHYRTVLPNAGWRVVEDDGEQLRAERGPMAFGLTLCGDGGVVWAGRHTSEGGASCGDDDMVSGDRLSAAGSCGDAGLSRQVLSDDGAV
jgi:hypothetical protein